jgi:predicted nucleic acid-binding protein
VVDTSAWACARAPAVGARWRQAAESDQLIGCPIVTLELLYNARDRAEVEAVARGVAAMRRAPVGRAVTDAAIAAMRALAAEGPTGSHRVRVPDALVAAAAADRGFGVLHYDDHFDRLATVLSFTSQWIAPRGSIS